MLYSIPLLSSLLSVASAGELALYWGQASAGSQKSLSDYCQNSAGDIYLISFLTTFGSGRDLGMNIAGYYDFFEGTQLLNAPQIGEQIKTCQGLGKKVLLSLGGASGSYGFNSNADAEKVASDLWNLFGGGQSSTRPFGDAKIDGFDLDGENNIDAQYYVPFVNKLRQLYATDASKQYLATAAPQCPFPDATLGESIAHADLDYWFIQFYNNYCSLNGNNFNLDTWQEFASKSAPNKNVKLLVGLPGSPSAAGSGYLSADEVKAKRSEYENAANWGGFMVWDASQANQNVANGKTFAQSLKEIAGGEAPAPAPPAPASTSSAAAPASTTSAANQPGAPVTTSKPGNGAIPAVTTGSEEAWYPAVTSAPVLGANKTVSRIHTLYETESCSAGCTHVVTEGGVATAVPTSGSGSGNGNNGNNGNGNGNGNGANAGNNKPAASAETSQGKPAAEATQAKPSTEAAEAKPTAEASKPVAPVEAGESAGASTTHSVSTITSTVASTNTVTAAPTTVAAVPEPSDAASCYTVSNKVVVVRTKWQTVYTTKWI